MFANVPRDALNNKIEKTIKTFQRTSNKHLNFANTCKTLLELIKTITNINNSTYFKKKPKRQTIKHNSKKIELFLFFLNLTTCVFFRKRLEMFGGV